MWCSSCKIINLEMFSLCHSSFLAAESPPEPCDILTDPSLVTITLTSTNLRDQLAERSLVLTPDNPVIAIGRASKSPKKGLVGAVDNAWFDSPVMSRDHAQIVFDPPLKVCHLLLSSGNYIDIFQSISIEDIGSMHGTYLNNKRLYNGEGIRLINGDTLILGAEVKRGSEIYPACVFKVKYEFGPYHTNSTFRLPDPSDIDEEEDYRLSEDELDVPPITVVRTSIFGTRIETPISLDSPVPSQVAPQIESAADFKISMACPPIDEPVLSQAAPSQVPAPIAALQTPSRTFSVPIIDLDTDEDDEPYSSEDEHQSVVASDSDSSEPDEDSGVEVPDSPSEGHREDDRFDLNDYDIDETDESEGSPDDSAPAPMFTSDDEQAANPACQFESSDGEDNQSELSLSEAGREGIQALFEDGLLAKDGSPDLDDSNTQQIPVLDGSNNKIAKPSSEQPPMGFFTVSSSRPESARVLRQPSPSDAAMVKPATATPSTLTKTSTPLTSEWQGFGTASYEDKTRKTAFFEARLHNKAVFESVAGTSTDWTEPTLDRTFTTAQPLSYLYDHSQAPPIPQRDVKPELDMTSAVTFNKSREALVASDNIIAPGSRSGLSIRDIIEVPKKRKAEEISDVDSDEEVRMWASSPATNNEKPVTNVCEVVPIALRPALVSGVPEGRPIKRFKRFAERLGYAAIGGAAVGAGLFSVLVATAPDFLYYP